MCIRRLGGEYLGLESEVESEGWEAGEEGVKVR
jgi:hypothetical protein